MIRGDTEGWRLFGEFCPRVDCAHHEGNNALAGARPFETIDGQHRTRGLNHYENSRFENIEGYGYCVYDIPEHHNDRGACEAPCKPGHWLPMEPPTRTKIPYSISIFGITEEEDAAKAKIFVDINTRAEELNPNHKLTMLYRHSVSDGKIITGSSKQDWNEPSLDFGDSNTEESRIYRLILDMTRLGNATNFSQTRGMVPPLVNRDGENNQISIRKMREFLKHWMRPNGIFCGYNAFVNSISWATVFNNYLCAWAWHMSHPVPQAYRPDWFDDGQDVRYWTPSHIHTKLGTHGGLQQSLDSRKRK